MLLIRFLIQKAVYLYKKKTQYEEITELETFVHDSVPGEETDDNEQNDLSSPIVVEKLRLFGLSRPIEEMYISGSSFTELPYALFLVCVYTAQESSFVGVSQTLFGLRPDWGHIDGIALASGIVSLLTQYDICYSQIV